MKSLFIHSFILSFFLSFLLITAQTNDPLYPDAEITLQVYNNDAYKDVVLFTLHPIGEAYKWDDATCDYTVGTMEPIKRHIKGDALDNTYYFLVDNADNIPDPDSLKFLLGLLEIKVEVGGIDPHTSYFYFDVRDCQYYSPGDCPHGPSADITIRFDRESGDIWYIEDGTPSPDEPSEDNGWELVTGKTKNAWERMGLPHCPLTPATPTGFSLTGGIGNHPILSWDANSEEMLDGYNLYRDINQTGYHFLVKLDKNQTSYIDNEVIIGNSKTDPSVCYKLTAFGKANNESDPTYSKCTKASGISKESKSTTELTREITYKLFDAYPNPFNPTVKIRYSIPEKANVTLSIYNSLGKLTEVLVNGNRNKGIYEVELQGNNLASGNYYVVFKANDYLEVKRLLLIKMRWL